MNPKAMLLVPLLLAGCVEKEVDDLIDEDDDAEDGRSPASGDCPEEDLGSALGRAVAEGRITRSSTLYRYCGEGGDSGISGGWGSGGSGTGGSSRPGAGTTGGPPPPDGPDGGGSPGRSFRWTAPSGGSFVFDTCGSQYDTTLGIRRTDCQGETLQCNDDWYGLRSRVELSADAGDAFIIVVSGFGGDVGRYTLSVGEGDEAGDCAGDSGWGWTTTTSPETTGGTTGWSGASPAVRVSWGPETVELAVSGGPGAYWFGIAETAGCEDCWTGEDCIFGYETDGMTLSYCHDAGDVGALLFYGGDAAALPLGSTAFPGPDAAERVTYYLESDTEYGGDGSCYVWGADVSYYDGLGCMAL